MSCLRSNFLTRRTMASSARSSMRLETYHSGSFSFLCGAVGWQKSAGMALQDAAAKDLDDIDQPHDHQHHRSDRVKSAAQPHFVVGHMHVSLQHPADHENPGQDDKSVACMARDPFEDGEDIEKQRQLELI